MLLVLIESFPRSRKLKEEWAGDSHSSICKKGFYFFLSIALREPETGVNVGNPSIRSTYLRQLM